MTLALLQSGSCEQSSAGECYAMTEHSVTYPLPFPHYRLKRDMTSSKSLYYMTQQREKGLLSCGRIVAKSASSPPPPPLAYLQVLADWDLPHDPRNLTRFRVLSPSEGTVWHVVHSHAGSLGAINC